MTQLIDTHGRTLNYLRLSVTDRCNFRCYYCMPEEGMNFATRTDLLTFDELVLLSSACTELGVSKIRITGGEPFVRQGIMAFLERLSGLPLLKDISITTNGSITVKHINRLVSLGIRNINISLDSLNRERFYRITRRDEFDAVYRSVFALLELGFNVKLNCVVAAGKNTEDIIPFIELTKKHELSVRFLEEMPFNGGSAFDTHNWHYTEILAHIKVHYPDVVPLESEATSTSVNYRVPGYEGSFGIIPSFSRTFCGTCNRLRLSATGELRTCLYGAPAANLRDVLRGGAGIEELKNIIIAAVAKRDTDGFAAEVANRQTHESMSLLGG